MKSRNVVHCVLLAVIVLLSASIAHAGTTELVSVSSDGTQGNSRSYDPAISADGRFVAFISASSNLVPNDTNGQWDVFVHDRETGDTVRVSVSSDGTEGNNTSYRSTWHLSMNANGRYVAFSSLADNLVPGDTNNTWDVFVHDRDADEDGIFDEQAQPGGISTTRVSVDSAGGEGNDISAWPVLSADGRHIAFTSFADNLVPNDSNECSGYACQGATGMDVFVHDRNTGTTERVSLMNGGQFRFNCEKPSMSADGRYVAFHTARYYLGPYDIYIHDRETGSTIWAVESGERHSLSGDGRYLAFDTGESKVANDTNAHLDVYVYDRDADGNGIFDETGETSLEIVSVSNDGIPGNSQSAYASLSADGRFVAFFSSASNLVPGGHNADVFIYDRISRTIERLSDGFEGPANNGSSEPSISAGGGYVAFMSHASNLVPGDINGQTDIFVRGRISIRIIEAVYDYLNDTLSVKATSDYGDGAALELGGYGPMTWNSKKSLWEATISNMVSPPDSITVCGVEGCETN